MTANYSELKALKGLLFDKDGTLIDISLSWLEPMKAAAKLVAQKANQPELADQLLIKGGYLPEQNCWADDSIIAFETSEAMFDIWSEMTNRDLIDSLVPQIQSIVHDSLMNAVPVIDDIKPLFELLAQHYTLGVASMDDHENVNTTLHGLDLHEQIAFYCGADSNFGHKPAAGMVQAFCEQVSLRPDQIAVIGDSNHDLKMARSAGAVAIAVLSGASSEENLSENADYIFDDIKALSTHLLP